MTKTEKKYVRNGGHRCPVCESDQIVGDSLDSDDGGSFMNVACQCCESEWTDYLTLTECKITKKAKKGFVKEFRYLPEVPVGDEQEGGCK